LWWLRGLQWGRDQLVAESHVSGASGQRLCCCFNGAATNWSRRGVFGPEGRARRVASMGPRPIGRGELIPLRMQRPVNGASMGPRPIGRGESRDSTDIIVILSGFNGAATNWSRRVVATRPGSLRASRRFNGAATNWSRRARHSMCLPQLAVGFNGAATNWSRRAKRSRQRLIFHWCFNGAATNWSRRGGSSSTKDRSRAISLQWGRDQLVAESQRKVNPTAAAEECFNGAATNWSRRVTHGRPARRTAPHASMGPRPIGRGEEH